jgi:hypothetical protein
MALLCPSLPPGRANEALSLLVRVSSAPQALKLRNDDQDQHCYRRQEPQPERSDLLQIRL